MQILVIAGLWLWLRSAPCSPSRIRARALAGTCSASRWPARGLTTWLGQTFATGWSASNSARWGRSLHCRRCRPCRPPTAWTGRLTPNLAFRNGLEPDWISRDAAVVKAYIDDPLVHHRITPKLVRFIVAGGEFVRAHAARWRVPTLLLYAGSDRCVAPAGSAAFAAAATARVVTARVFAAVPRDL